ncbi:hypothetical protein FNBNMHLP_03238 [Aeromonas jandaei]
MQLDDNLSAELISESFPAPSNDKLLREKLCSIR